MSVFQHSGRAYPRDVATRHERDCSAPSEYHNRVLAVGLVASLVLIDVLWIAVTPNRFTLQGMGPGVTVSLILIVMGIVYSTVRRSERIANLAFDGLVLLVFSHAACIFSYLVVTLGGPLHDETMVALDAYLGFDWRSYVSLFLSHPNLRVFAFFTYTYTLALVIFTFVWLSLTGRVVRSREFIASIVLGGVLCIAISGLLPTAGAVGYFMPDESFYRGYSISVDTRYMDEYFALRGGSDHVLSVEDPKGLIAFPSYHACMAMLIVLAYRGTRTMLWTMIVLNSLTLIVVPVEGGHHLSDAIGGVLVAFWASALVRWLSGGAPQRIAPQ